MTEPSSRMLQAAWRWATEVLLKSSSPRLDAQCLLAFVLNIEPAVCYAQPDRALTDGQWRAFQDLVERRLKGEPIAYLVGERGFWRQNLMVTSDVLVPRPETECLVDAALRWVPKIDPVILDLGTGSGALILALAAEKPAARLHAVDRSARALHVAQMNHRGDPLTAAIPIQFYCGNWCEPLDPNLQCDLIVSNPPYLSEQEWREDAVDGLSDLRYEPKDALVSGQTGLEAYEVLLSTLPQHLAPDGIVALEHGASQQSVLADKAQALEWMVLEKGNDIAGLPRYLILKRSSHGHGDC